MKLSQYRKLIAYFVTTLSVVGTAIVTQGWGVLTDENFLSMVSVLLVGGYAVWGTPNEPEEILALFEDLSEFEETGDK